MARREFALAGNREGLLLLASHLVSLAKAASPGEHVHFDKHSNLDEANGKLVIAYEPAPWEDRRTSTSRFSWGQSVRVRADADVEPQSRRGAVASICGIRPSEQGGEIIYLIEFSDGAAIELSESQLEPLP